MTVAFDAATENIAAADPQTFTHTPVGTPRGVIVLIAHDSISTDIVVGVTYGAVAMTRVRSNVDTAGEPGRSYIYFLGAGIPTGAQTVSVDRTEATTSVLVVSITITAADDTEVVNDNGIDQNVANPQVTLLYANRMCLAFCVLYSGSAAIPVGTLLAGMSRVHDHDFGAFVGTVDRQTIAGSVDFPIGYTLAADDVAFSALAISERTQRHQARRLLTPVGYQ